MRSKRDRMSAAMRSTSIAGTAWASVSRRRRAVSRLAIALGACAVLAEPERRCSHDLLPESETGSSSASRIEQTIGGTAAAIRPRCRTATPSLRALLSRRCGRPPPYCFTRKGWNFRQSARRPCPPRRGYSAPSAPARLALRAELGPGPAGRPRPRRLPLPHLRRPGRGQRSTIWIRSRPTAPASHRWTGSPPPMSAATAGGRGCLSRSAGPRARATRASRGWSPAPRAAECGGARSSPTTWRVADDPGARGTLGGSRGPGGGPA